MNAPSPLRSERLRAYLDDTLDEAELERFELELFHNPELVDAVEAERLLRLGMQSLAEIPGVAETVYTTPPRRYWPIAAALLAGAALPSLVLWQRDAAVPEAEANVAVLRLDTLRGGSGTTLLAPADAPRLILQFPLLAQSGVSDYELEIANASDNQQALRVPALHPRSDGLVSVAIRSQRLPAGVYTARVFARQGDGQRVEVLRQGFTLAR
ncbi:hypothetical protein DFR29_11096 [Tahibacter aquaticus]|uniref:Zinc-finger domain-containing protein n=1 Tax=Tahibacter aquaticus TaxID=520092 RepID=A0A4R6YT99_9GAMM|nr:hypothetical protein [Tahibacter aquaticus]TDR41613.1 hypothetical protein DFR29_11096 [Tahibacter aquaticus]